MRKYPKSILAELQSSSLEAPGHVDHGDMPWPSWFYHGRPWRCSKKDTRNSGIGNFELPAEPRVGRVRVDALGAAAPFALVRAPPVGLEGFLDAVLAHFERLEDLDVRRRGPSLLANFHQLGLAVPVLTNKS